MSGLDGSFQQMSPASCQDVYSFAKSYLSAKASQGGTLKVPCTLFLLELPCVSVRSSNTLTKLQDAGHLPIKKTIQLKLEDVICFLLYSKEKRRTKVSERVAVFLPESGQVSVTTPHHLRTGLSLVPFQLPLPQHPRISPI